jgi:hypothetical protein
MASGATARAVVVTAGRDLAHGPGATPPRDRGHSQPDSR